MERVGQSLEPAAEESAPAKRKSPDTVNVHRRPQSERKARGQTPPTTIHLLKSGRRRSDGPGDPDSALESELAMLLSGLEFHRAKLAEFGQQRKPAAALQAVRNMTQELIAFTEGDVARLLDANALAVALSPLGDLHTSAQLLVDHLNRTNSFTAILFFWNKPAVEPAQAPELFRHVFDTLLQMLRGVFACVDGTFVAPAAAQQWKQALEMFLKDLSDTARQLQY